jgi:hypothetical protein
MNEPTAYEQFPGEIRRRVITAFFLPAGRPGAKT